MYQTFETAFARYGVVGQIGQGGSGRVFEVRDDKENKFALKLLNIERSDGKTLTRFKNEMMFCLRKHHPNIISVLDFGYAVKAKVKSPFYVMPLCSQSLRKMMNSSIPKERVLPLYSQLLNAVEAAHLNKVFHRDLKPENILFLEPPGLLLLADFGIARFLEKELYESVESGSKERLANFNYAAPEQKQRGVKADERTDIFALGLLLNELFTSEIPQGTNFKQIKDVAPELEYLDRLVAEMIRQQPIDRPSRIAVVKERLLGYGNEFVIEQKLSQLKRQVIPTTELDDPLIADPPGVVGIEYLGGNLFIKLSRSVNQKWIDSFHGLHSFRARGGPPEAFQFGLLGATIIAAPHEVQDTVNDFKSWLPDVQRIYKAKIERELAEADRQKRDNLRRETEAEETRLRVLRETKI